MTVAPGAMIGLSIDQSHSRIDISDLPQRANLDLTQIGLNGIYEIQGISEGRLGLDAGDPASYRVARNARIYAAYDGRFRNGYHVHGGSLGLEVSW